MIKTVTNILAGVTITAIAMNTGFAEEEPAKPNTVPQSLVYTVTADDNSNVTILGGSVIPYKMVNLSAQLPGAVQFVAGQEGDFFTKDSPLVSLNTASLRAKRQQAVAQYKSANAGLNNAVVQYRREALSPNSQANSMLAGMPSMFTMFSDPMRSMSGQGDPGYERHSSMYGQSVQVETAKNQVNQAEAAIKELDENLKNAISNAPFDGTIVKKMIEVGDIIQPGMPLLVFADTSKMQVQVEVPTKLVSALREGDAIQVTLAKGSQSVNGTVSRVFPMANMGGHTTTVKVDLPTGSGAKAGMYAEVMVPNKGPTSAARPMIPESAVSWRGSLPAVFLVSDDLTTLKMKTLRLGKAYGSDVTVLSGLKVGDKVFAAPQITTRSGPYQGQTGQ